MKSQLISVKSQLISMVFTELLDPIDFCLGLFLLVFNFCRLHYRQGGARARAPPSLWAENLKKSGEARKFWKIEFACAVFSLQILHTRFAQETSNFRDFGIVIFRSGCPASVYLVSRGL
jgi:hypothetical protein